MGGELKVYSNEFRQFLSVIDPFFASRPPPADNMQISASNWNFTHSPLSGCTKNQHFLKMMKLLLVQNICYEISFDFEVKCFYGLS